MNCRFQIAFGSWLTRPELGNLWATAPLDRRLATPTVRPAVLSIGFGPNIQTDKAWRRNHLVLLWYTSTWSKPGIFFDKNINLSMLECSAGQVGKGTSIARNPSKNLPRCETNQGCTQNKSNVLGFTNTTLCTAQLQTPCHNTLRERFLWKSSLSNFSQTSVCSMSIYINTLHMNLCLLVLKKPRLTDSSPARTGDVLHQFAEGFVVQRTAVHLLHEIVNLSQCWSMVRHKSCKVNWHHEKKEMVLPKKNPGTPDSIIIIFPIANVHFMGAIR